MKRYYYSCVPFKFIPLCAIAFFVLYGCSISGNTETQKSAITPLPLQKEYSLYHIPDVSSKDTFDSILDASAYASWYAQRINVFQSGYSDGILLFTLQYIPRPLAALRALRNSGTVDPNEWKGHAEELKSTLTMDLSISTVDGKSLKSKWPELLSYLHFDMKRDVLLHCGEQKLSPLLYHNEINPIESTSKLLMRFKLSNPPKSPMFLQVKAGKYFREDVVIPFPKMVFADLPTPHYESSIKPEPH